MSKAYTRLWEFLNNQMRMSHIYQPVMLRALLLNGGKASLRQIAAEFLKRDESQLEYYEEITKAMPGKVLAKHGLVAREPEGYRLTVDPAEITNDERAEIVRLCDKAVDDYLRKRGVSAYDHRRASLGYVSGSLRYEVLKISGGRCELCGVPAEERAIEIDHIRPRKHGGSDDLSNLQALCYKCNANKGAKDDTDFRAVRAARDHREANCVFCDLSPNRIIVSNELAVAIYDQFPVTQLHALLIPRRHAHTYFELFEPERRAISRLLEAMRTKILERDRDVRGFNVGMNCGEVAGQTVPHAHVHLIPRREGDVSNPRGGVRGVIPGKADY